MPDPEVDKEQADSKERARNSNFYSNSVQISMGVYDFNLTFGLRREPGQEAVETITIFMSPQHALSLQILLDRFLKLYEKNLGPVSLPADLRKRLGEAD